jgi:hypothetical protein
MCQCFCGLHAKSTNILIYLLIDSTMLFVRANVIISILECYVSLVFSQVLYVA